MEQYTDNAELKQILKRFHDKVDLTSQQLSILLSYLFTNQYAVPDFINQEYLSTLDYFKDIIAEMRFTNLAQLVKYLDDIVQYAEEDLKETLNASEIISVEPDSLHSIFEKDELSLINNENTNWRNYILKYFNVLCIDHVNTNLITDFNRYLVETETASNIREKYFAYESFHFLTKIHVHHFIDSLTCGLFISDREKSKGIQLVDVEDLWLPIHYFDDKTFYYLFDDKFVDRFDWHYDLLIKQLAIEKPIFNEDIKIQLTQWMFYFKLKSSKINSQLNKSCNKDILVNKVSNYNDELYDIFQKMTQWIYRNKFSDKDWIVLKSPHGHSWLTTEDPGFSVDLEAFTSLYSQLQPDPDLTDLEQTSIIYFPLSKDYCLRIQPKNYDLPDNKKEHSDPIIFVESSALEFKTINSMTASTNRKLLLSADKYTLEQFVDQDG